MRFHKEELGQHRNGKDPSADIQQRASCLLRPGLGSGGQNVRTGHWGRGCGGCGDCGDCGDRACSPGCATVKRSACSWRTAVKGILPRSDVGRTSPKGGPGCTWKGTERGERPVSGGRFRICSLTGPFSKNEVTWTPGINRKCHSSQRVRYGTPGPQFSEGGRVGISVPAPQMPPWRPVDNVPGPPRPHRLRGQREVPGAGRRGRAPQTDTPELLQVPFSLAIAWRFPWAPGITNA